jgi:hypothetical protein
VGLQASLLDYNAPPAATGIGVSFNVQNADSLFASSYSAFSNLAGSTGLLNSGSSAANQGFVWGLPFFYGRTVYASVQQSETALLPIFVEWE